MRLTLKRLDYLHNGCKPPIVHRDLKASNILLNEKLQAKIAYFGLSKVLATESATHISTDAKGTFGYLDAEYCNIGQLNRKSDVYSFGIVLLELITGRAAIIRDVEPFPIHICQWVTPIYENMEIEKIVDSRIQGTYNNFSAQKAIEIAMACVRSSAIQRPEISSVYVELKGCLEIEMTSDQVTTVTEIDESDDDTNSSSSVLVT
ncbi:putative transferase, protein kinase RLK-Pelle-LRR-I-1 family [Rosa chinensis]|uniref:Putative transferase, protein kinase RLK-Pelle-LRR-I-1 family n=1 Tax=Rosa chinensis TaxID=74649 RepID=A0A2P6RDE3_ROSCH|nr:putative transferase, protein kinase RLK-Pelle-LRR-I-1 family [Rosa chinensis]